MGVVGGVHLAERSALSVPLSHRPSAHTSGSAAALTVSLGRQTCTPRPCIWMTWARRDWMAARISFWCSREVMPRLSTSLRKHKSKDFKWTRPFMGTREERQRTEAATPHSSTAGYLICLSSAAPQPETQWDNATHCTVIRATDSK